MIKLSEPVVKQEMKAPAFIEDHYYTNQLLDNLTTHYLKDREGVHVSDLVGTCPRKVVFTKLDKHRELTERQLMYFWDGEAIDEKLRKTFTEIVPGDYNTDAHFDYGPIVARPDLIDNTKQCIIELKTTDPSADTFLPKQHNMYQLMSYMAIADMADGVLWYHLITRKLDKGLWREFHIHLDEKARSEIRQALLEDAQRFEQAMDERNPYLARHTADDPTLNKWMCVNYCPYVKQCTEGFVFREQWFKDHPAKLKALSKKYSRVK